jgi:5-methylcytosine-specific restriction enzyme subunit McrC
MATVFRDVSEVAYPIHAVPNPTFTRLNRQWEAPARLARLILAQEALKDELGTTQGTAFTVDMNKVFEKFVEEIVGIEARRNGLELGAQDDVKLTPKVNMTPDLILHQGSARVAVGDAKYIEAESAEWPNANLYRLLAYCVALGLPRGLLIYASARPAEVQRVAAAGIDLEAIGIDLEASTDELMRQANVAAQRLIEHARAQSDAVNAQVA